MNALEALHQIRGIDGIPWSPLELGLKEINRFVENKYALIAHKSSQRGCNGLAVMTGMMLKVVSSSLMAVFLPHANLCSAELYGA